jgi:hypothetical protein
MFMMDTSILMDLIIERVAGRAAYPVSGLRDRELEPKFPWWNRAGAVSRHEEATPLRRRAANPARACGVPED